MRVTIIAAMLMALASPAVSQTVKSGIDAWTAGEADRAVAIWRPLAERGNADAAFNLAQAYRLGRGVSTDLAQAQSWYERAARAGHVEAATSLGLLLFQNGDRKEALRWLGQAADATEVRAMLIYGTALFNGDGVPQDRVRAYAFVSRAAARGLPAARETLAEMDALMPLEERRKGVALAQSWAKRTAPKSAAARPASARPAATPATAAVKGAPAAPAASGGFRIQLGAFGSRGAAEALYARLSPRLGGAAPVYAPSGTMTRLQVGPYASRAAASAACARLAPQPCFPVVAR